MEEKKQRKNLPLIVGLSVFFILAVALATLCYQLINRVGLFRQPGELSFTEEIPTTAREKLQESLDTTELKANVQIGLSRQLAKTDSDLLYNIYVPVSDFYDTNVSISSTDLETATLIPLNELDAQHKLLAIDNNYYLDNFQSGAVFEYLELTGESSQDLDLIHNLIKDTLPSFPNSDNVLSFAQTGVTALSRGMNAKLKTTGDAKYFIVKISDYLNKFDLTHTSNESSFSNYATENNICSHPDMIDVITSSGIDIIELTGNHNQDCGDEDAIATIDLYHSLGLQTVGGGPDQITAAESLGIKQKDNHITMLAYNLSTGGYTLDDTPGANYYTLEKATTDIAAAKTRGDFVIVDVQYNECSAYVDTAENTTCDYADSSAGDQIGFFRGLIDLGADLVVGTSAHQPQTFELYHGKPIYYGLGNLFFDQYWWPGTTRSLVLEHYFYQNKLLQTRIIPTVYDSTMQTELMDAESANKFIQRLVQARPKDSEEVRK